VKAQVVKEEKTKEKQEEQDEDDSATWPVLIYDPKWGVPPEFTGSRWHETARKHKNKV